MFLAKCKSGHTPRTMEQNIFSPKNNNYSSLTYFLVKKPKFTLKVGFYIDNYNKKKIYFIRIFHKNWSFACDVNGVWLYQGHGENPQLIKDLPWKCLQPEHIGYDLSIMIFNAIKNNRRVDQTKYAIKGQIGEIVKHINDAYTSDQDLLRW